MPTAKINTIEQVTFKIQLGNGGDGQQNFDPTSIVTAKNIGNAIWGVVVFPIKMISSIVTKNCSNSNMLEIILKILLIPPLLVTLIAIGVLVGAYRAINSLFSENNEQYNDLNKKIFARSLFAILREPENMAEIFTNAQKQEESSAIQQYIDQKSNKQEYLFKLEAKFFLPTDFLRKNTKNNELFLDDKISDVIISFIGEDLWEECMPVTDKDIKKSPINYFLEMAGGGLINNNKKYKQTLFIPINARVMQDSYTGKNKFACELKIIMPYSIAQQVSHKIDDHYSTRKTEGILDQARQEFASQNKSGAFEEIKIEDLDELVQVSCDAQSVESDQSTAVSF